MPALRPDRTEPYPLDRLATVLGAEPPAGAEGSAGLRINGVAFDSRRVLPHDLYVGLPGANTHGARFATAARDAGAVAVLTDADGSRAVAAAGVDLPVLVVEDPRRSMATAAAEVYGRPATKLIMLGVTGTNGKTTTSYLLSAGMAAAGRSCGLIGTIGYFLDGREIVGDRSTVTTPESPDVQALLAIMLERGADAVVMEVSSHALSLGRADEIVFAAAGFTNFGSDHLDFHGSVEAYWQAKARLFTAAHAERTVINIDDARGSELIAQATAEGLPVATSSMRGDPVPDHDRTGDEATGHDQVQAYRCLAYDPTRDPVQVQIATPGGRIDFRLGLPGSYNVANALTALAMLDQVGIDLRSAARGLASAAVPGRLQRVDLGQQAPRVFVDFAHTPQAVGSVLSELSELSGERKLITVVGCGGDRDPGKRGPMGAAAARWSDVVIITDDNPRTEDPAAIRAAALAGAREEANRRGAGVQVLDGGDRAQAIRLALREASPVDVITVLGKGHERGQEVGGTVLPFDDTEQVLAGWRELSASTTGRQQ